MFMSNFGLIDKIRILRAGKMQVEKNTVNSINFFTLQGKSAK